MQSAQATGLQDGGHNYKSHVTVRLAQRFDCSPAPFKINILLVQVEAFFDSLLR